MPPGNMHILPRALAVIVKPQPLAQKVGCQEVLVIFPQQLKCYIQTLISSPTPAYLSAAG